MWGNTRAKVRQSRTEVLARQLDLADVETQLSASLQQQYATALALQQTADRLKDELKLTGNARLLRRSLDEGQISLL
ncbi:TolC family protein, partial [Acinetobacter sp. 163]|nr:TolC family protein [Acinetobacter sp. 163]